MQNQGQITRLQCNASPEEDLERKINSITEQQRGYLKSIFKKMAQANPHNGVILYDFLITQQNELNIKESTKENILKKIVWLSVFLNHKTFHEITKEDILGYLNSIRKPVSGDPTHKWIGTYNGKQMVYSTFFRWLYNPDEPDTRKRITPTCMRGIRGFQDRKNRLTSLVTYGPLNKLDLRHFLLQIQLCYRIRQHILV